MEFKIELLQPHGAMLIVDKKDLTILSYSQNINTFLYLLPQQIKGLPITQFLKSSNKLTQVKKDLLHTHNEWRDMYIDSNGHRIAYWVYIQQFKNYIMLEIEPVYDDESLANILILGQHFMKMFQVNDKTSGTFPKFIKSLCHDIQNIIKCDQVQLYVFEQDNSCKVIGEATKKGIASNLNLKFLKNEALSSIKDAFLNSPIYYIPNIDCETQPLNTFKNSDININLNKSYLGFSNLPVSYMKNMGIKSAVLLGIIYNNNLWGVIACNNYEIRYLSVPERYILMLVAKSLASYLLVQDNNQKIYFRNKALKIQNNFLSLVSRATVISEALNIYHKDILSLLSANGMSIYMQKTVLNFGKTPSADEVIELVNWISETYPNIPYVSHSFQQEYKKAKSFNQKFGGIYAIPILKLDKYYIIFYRPEIVNKLTWAENPLIPSHKPPKAFLEKYENEITGLSQPWTYYEITSGDFFASTIASKKLHLLLEEKASHDPLTNLLNRSSLFETLNNQIENYHQLNKPFSILILDIDYFKKINDTYGHLAGDAVLVKLAKFLNKNLRQNDTIYRYGGEEFIVLLPNSNKDGAFQKADMLLKNVRKLTIDFEGKKLPHITLSIGVASYPEDQIADQSLIEIADKALYQAKNTGRDKIVLASK